MFFELLQYIHSKFLCLFRTSPIPVVPILIKPGHQLRVDFRNRAVDKEACRPSFILNADCAIKTYFYSVLKQPNIVDIETELRYYKT